MAEALRKELILPTVPDNIEPDVKLYLLQLTELIQKQFTDAATWEGVDVESDLVGWVNRGDPAGFDYVQANFTTDGTWRDLDISSIVPVNAVVVAFKLILTDDAVGSIFGLRKNGDSNGIVTGGTRTEVANVAKEVNFVISCDNDRVVEYFGSNLTFTTINLVVNGWWLNA